MIHLSNLTRDPILQRFFDRGTPFAPAQAEPKPVKPKPVLEVAQ